MPKTPKEIVEVAYNYLISVTSGKGIANPRVEEIEQIEENKFWRVVLSYEAIGQFPFENKKEYKEFKINAEDGTVIYMKIKNP